MFKNETLFKNQLKGCITVAIFALIYSCVSLFAQEKKQHDVIPLSLTRGVYFDQDIPLAPKNFKRGGFYKKIADVEYISKDRKIRITP